MDFSRIAVLLVEDDQAVRMTLSVMLAELGVAAVYEAKDGKEALDLFEENQLLINLIICDWNMPHKTGLELLREVRQVAPHLPFLMVTARADLPSIQTAKNAGVTAYIRKPFDLVELEKKIAAVFAV